MHPHCYTPSRMHPDELGALRGLCVLLVEDNYVLAQSMKWALESLGCEVMGPAPSSNQALELLADGLPDAAILDIDLRGESSAPVAEYLQNVGLPFLFLTGYESAAVLPDSLHGRACLNKPVDPDVLAIALAAEVGYPADPPAKS